MIFEFEGIPSGDHENFCWDVARDEYLRITGELPTQFEISYFYLNTYRLYPGHYELGDVPSLLIQPGNIWKVKVETEETDTNFEQKITAQLVGPADPIYVEYVDNHLEELEIGLADLAWDIDSDEEEIDEADEGFEEAMEELEH